MPLPTLHGVLRITAAGQVQGGGRWSNTWHARNRSLIDFDAGGVTGFHAIFRQVYGAASVGGGEVVMQHTLAGTTCDSFTYTPLDGSSGSFHFVEAFAGSGSGSTMPAEVAECLTIRTAFRGRQNRGRIYYPAFEVSDFDANGLIKAAVITALLLQINGVQAALVSGGADLGVASYGPYVAAGAPHFTPVSSFTMDTKPDVQRSRKT